MEILEHKARSILSLRRPGVERLLESLPPEVMPESKGQLRSWSLALMADASRWEVERAKHKARRT